MGEMRANFSEENMRSLPVPYCANRTCARMEAPFMNKSKSQLSKKKKLSTYNGYIPGAYERREAARTVGTNKTTATKNKNNNNN